MSVASNLITAVMLGPVVVVLSALSLTVLVRSLEWIASIAKNPTPKGFMRDIRPYMKNVHSVIDRIMGGVYKNC
jgi:hypothetical protein